ncbi:hypothetical protein Tco_0434965 [Tanacetum coccineum]
MQYVIIQAFVYAPFGGCCMEGSVGHGIVDEIGDSGINLVGVEGKPLGFKLGDHVMLKSLTLGKCSYSANGKRGKVSSKICWTLLSILDRDLVSVDIVKELEFALHQVSKTCEELGRGVSWTIGSEVIHSSTDWIPKGSEDFVKEVGDEKWHTKIRVTDPYVIMEYLVKLCKKEEKACRRGKVYNWETATYGKIWENEDIHDLRSVKTEFPSIVFNDTLTSEAALSCEPTVNSENDNDKVNMPLLPSLEPTVSYFDDLDYFKDFKNEFPAIFCNDALTSKSDFLTEPTVSPQHIDDFNLKDETPLSECDEEEQNVLYFNDLFSFNVIYPDNSKSDEDNDDDKMILNTLRGIYLSNHYLM